MRATEGKVHSVKCCKCMSPAMVCIKCFGSTQKTHLIIPEPETLQGFMCNPADKREGQACKVVVVVPLLRHAGVIKIFCNT